MTCRGREYDYITRFYIDLNVTMPRRHSDDSEALVSERRPPPNAGFVSNHFYRQGLLCASHPRVALFFTFLIIFWACFPLLYIPIYSGRTQTYIERVQGSNESSNSQPEPGLEEEPPRWKLSQPPEAYIQQATIQ